MTEHHWPDSQAITRSERAIVCAFICVPRNRHRLLFQASFANFPISPAGLRQPVFGTLRDHGTSRDDRSLAVGTIGHDAQHQSRRHLPP
jgi:hypothetical protein